MRKQEPEHKLEEMSQEKEALVKELEWAFKALAESSKSVNEPVEVIAVDTEKLLKDAHAVLPPTEAQALVRHVVAAMGVSQNGGKTLLDIDPAGLKTLQKLSQLLPHGIPVRVEAVLKLVYWQNDVGVHFILGRMLFPHSLKELHSWLPETFTFHGVQFHVPGLHELLEKFALENAALFVEAVKEVFGNRAAGKAEARKVTA